MGKVRHANIYDIKVLKNIIDECISMDFYSEEFIYKFINSDKGFVYVYTDDEDDTPLGCLFCEVGELEDICAGDSIPYPDESFDGYLSNTKTIVYKAAATTKSSRNKGILTEFLGKAEEETKKINHELKICLCCINPNEFIPVKHHVEKNGFIPKKRFKSPWSHIQSYCNCCKNEYCQCDGMLYVKENNNGK